MYRTAKTGVYTAPFKVMIRGQPPETYPDAESTFRAVQLLRRHTHFMIEQDDITTESLIRSVRVSRVIGEGSFGKVYSATSDSNLFGGSFVIKFPSALLRAHGVIVNRQGKIEINNTVIIPVETTEKIIDNFISEISNIEKVLTPIKQSERYRRRFENGRLVQTPGYLYNEIMREAQTYRRHSGHKHIHQFIHYNPDLFCIISELCDGNAYDLMESGDLAQLEKQKAFFIQMALVVHYLLFVVKVAHTDLKPENILYKKVNDTYTFKLSDFGYLDDIQKLQEDPSHNNNKFLHTPMYSPRSFIDIDPLRPYKFDTPKIMLYAFFASILHVLDFGQFITLNIRRAFANEDGTYPRQFHWLNKLNDICTPDMHTLLFQFLSESFNQSFWIYEGDEDWKRKFSQKMTGIVSSHNSHHPHLQYTIHIGIEQ